MHFPASALFLSELRAASAVLAQADIARKRTASVASWLGTAIEEGYLSSTRLRTEGSVCCTNS